MAKIIAANRRRLTEWSILDRRVRTPAGNVEIVARRAGIVGIVAVKTREDDARFDLARDRRRLLRVAVAAEILIPRYAQPGDDVRIDAGLIAAGQPPHHPE